MADIRNLKVHHENAAVRLAEREGLFAAYGGSPLKGAARLLRKLRVLSPHKVRLESNRRARIKASAHPHKHKSPFRGSCVYGGEGGIRTLEGLLTLTPLAGERFRPLSHLS